MDKYAIFVLVFTVLSFLPPILIYLYQEYASSKKDEGSHTGSKEENKPPRPLPTRITDLRVYPIKSCRGFRVEKTRLLSSGVTLDRQWMFVSASTHKFITIREISKMTLLTTSLSSGTDTEDKNAQLLVSSKADPNIKISVPAHPTQSHLEKNTEEIEVEIWSLRTPARAYPASITKDVSNFLGQDVLLVYKGPWTAPRILTGNGAPEYLGREQSMGFADMMPTLIGSEASMRDLNEKLRNDGNVDMEGGEWSIERFRPNIVIEGHKAWEEDVWKTVKIVPDTKASGKADEKQNEELVADVQMRCLRCRVPNVDPETAEKHEKQPWDTLMKNRRIDKGLPYKPAFGMLVAPRNEGEVKVGMMLEVIDTTAEHFFRSGMH
jgi:uncharacterized protein